jgi:hypothetical protein
VACPEKRKSSPIAKGADEEIRELEMALHDHRIGRPADVDADRSTIVKMTDDFTILPPHQ